MRNRTPVRSPWLVNDVAVILLGMLLFFFPALAPHAEHPALQYFPCIGGASVVIGVVVLMINAVKIGVKYWYL